MSVSMDCQRKPEAIIGEPALVEKIAGRIAREGPLHFAAFMEMALYDPEYGYYASSSRIGWKGDYYTSEDLHPLFGAMIARQVVQAASYIQTTSRRITIVEMGAGRGGLCRDLFTYLRRETPTFCNRIDYVIVERSRAMIRRQQETLRDILFDCGSVSWITGLHDLPTGGIEGMIISNECVDALPVHRIIVRNGSIRECCVDLQGDARFVEVEQPPVAEVTAYIDRNLTRRGIDLPEGSRAELGLDAERWMREAARVLRAGFVITIDYGYPAAELYSAQRSTGTLLCYFNHRVSSNPYIRVGQQDITAHVDFTALAAAGNDAGLDVTGFTNQQSFLMGLGLAEQAGAADQASIAQLVHPAGLGRTHKVLVQHTGMPTPALLGLKYRPFFSSSLFAMPSSGSRRG